MDLLKKHIILFTLFFIGVIVLFSSLNVKWGDNRWNSLIRDDAKGYYAYLPAVFIYQDLSFSFYDTVENSKYHYDKLEYDYRYTYKGGVVNKYYVGTAIAEMPFFLLAHILSKSLGYPNDGYSKIYWILIGYAAIFYMLLGLFFLAKILQLYELRDIWISIVLFSITLGTHLFYYTSFEPGMSHVYSFAFVSWFMFLVKKYFVKPEEVSVILIAALIGIIILIRPVNGLVALMIPFLAGSWNTLKAGFQFLIKKRLFGLIIGIFVILVIVSIQLIIYKIQTGFYIVYSYSQEGFNFLDSHFIDILFSYKKGLFLYTPLTFVSLIGGYFMYKKSKYELFTLLVFFSILTYVMSSWWNWWYGGSFSARVYVEYLPIFAILLSYILQEVNIVKWRNRFIILLFILIVSNQKQTYLYRIGYIHWAEMTKKKYWESLIYPVHWWYYELRNNVLEK